MAQSFDLRSVALFCALLLILGEAQSKNAFASSTAWQQPAADQESQPAPKLETSKDWNQRLQELLKNQTLAAASIPEDGIGSEDVLDINVFGAPDLNREVRVSTSGEISLPLIGEVRAAGLTPRELEKVLEALLRPKYINDPHVSVFVHEMQSHAVSVVGAVRKPGVFQIRGAKTLLEVLSLAEGLADDAGENAVILRGAGQQGGTRTLGANSGDSVESASPNSVMAKPVTTVSLASEDNLGSGSVIEVNLKELLESSDASGNPVVYAGDIVKVTRAGIVYVVGAVERPGGFTMKTSQGISVLQAMALSGGLTRTAAKSGVRIIRTDDHGARTETPIDVGRIIAGKAADPVLTSGDVVYVRDSVAKTAFSRGVEGAAQTLTGLLIFHW